MHQPLPRGRVTFFSYAVGRFSYCFYNRGSSRTTPFAQIYVFRANTDLLRDLFCSADNAFRNFDVLIIDVIAK